MTRYIISSILRLLLLLLFVSIACFLLIEFSPIDPLNSYITSGDVVSSEQRIQIETYFQLDKPPLTRFLTWFTNIIQLDFGISSIYRIPVIDIISDRFFNSLILMASALLLSGVIGISLGLVMGANNDRLLDKVIKTICLTLTSIPTFLLAMILLFVFSITLGWFPIGFSVPIGVLESEVSIIDRLHHMILPIITLALSSFSNIALHTREKLIEVLKTDYVLLSKTRGDSKAQIIKKHGLKNVLIPIITIMATQFSEIFAGSVLCETVFSYPGLASTIVEAGLRGDVALLLGVALCSAVFVFVGNLLANIMYGFLDPRIRLKKTNMRNKNYE